MLRMPGNRSWLLACLLLALAAAPRVALGERVRLLLKRGETIEGRVYDTHTEQLQLGRSFGFGTILKRDVERWSLLAGPDGAASTLLVLKSGHEVRGRVEFSQELGEWVVHLEAGSARYPDRDVLRIVRPSGICSDGAFTPRSGFQGRVAGAIEKVRAGGDAEREDALEFLSACGYFALPALEKAIAEGDPRGRLKPLLLRERFRIVLPDRIEESFPGFFQTLTGADTGERVPLLREALIERGPEIYPLLGLVLLDPAQPAEVRGFAVDVLQRMHRTHELVEAYRASTGQAQLALAVALGDMGVYIGVPTLIEALSLQEAEVRKLSAARLEEYTGESFGYDPQSDPESQKTAIARWRGWWREHQVQAETTLTYALHPERANPAAARAADFWRQGITAWNGGEIDSAEEFFRRAIEEDATSPAPFVSLGIISYREREDREAAIGYFRRALARDAGSGVEGLLRLAYYHLGAIYRDGLEYSLARQAFQRAIDLDPDYADAWYGLGMARYEQALRAHRAPVTERRQGFEKAAGTFERGLEALQSYRGALVFLDRGGLPIDSALPFSTRDHNRSLRDLKARIRAEEARFFHQIAVIRLALGDREKALEWVTKAAESKDPSADSLLLRASILRSLGKDEEAAKDLDRAREIDPEHPFLREG
ncbi:MAG: tetratricopeptide repeat protein [Planctomycetota bacterium]